MAAAMQADDVDRYVALLHDDFRYVRHKSNDTLNRDEMAALLGKVWGSGNRTIEDLRCIYENDDILVIYTRLKFRGDARGRDDRQPQAGRQGHPDQIRHLRPDPEPTPGFRSDLGLGRGRLRAPKSP